VVDEYLLKSSRSSGRFQHDPIGFSFSHDPDALRHTWTRAERTKPRSTSGNQPDRIRDRGNENEFVRARIRAACPQRSPTARPLSTLWHPVLRSISYDDGSSRHVLFVCPRPKSASADNTTRSMASPLKHQRITCFGSPSGRQTLVAVLEQAMRQYRNNLFNGYHGWDRTAVDLLQGSRVHAPTPELNRFVFIQSRLFPIDKDERSVLTR